VRKHKLIILLLTSLLIATVSFLLIPYSNVLLTKRLAKPPQVLRAQSDIKERTNIGISIAKELITISDEVGFDKAFNKLSSSTGKQLSKEGIAIFLFENNDLKFWSENIDISEVPEFSDRLVKVQNTWCISYWIASESIKGLVLVKVRYSYPYQNQFLRNQFHHSLSFLEGYSVSPDMMHGAFPVNIFSSAPVFNLTYIPKDFDRQLESLIAFFARIGFLFLLLAIYTVFWFPFIRKRGYISIVLMFFVLIGVRVISLYWSLIPQGSWKLFGPEIFAYSWFIPSLGDLLINSSIIFGIGCYASNIVQRYTPVKKRVVVLFAYIFAAASLGLLVITDNLFSILVLNSTINLEAYRIFHLSIFSLLEYLSVSLWFSTAILTIHISLHLIAHFSRRERLLCWVASLAIVTVLALLFGGFPSWSGVILVLFVSLVLGYFYPKSRVINSGVFIVLVFLFSVYTVVIVSKNAERKDREVRKILAINLSNERDPIAEVMFAQIARELHSDQDVVFYLDNIVSMESDLYQHISDNYLTGYFKKYDFQITVCLPISDLRIEKTGDVIRCYDFFEDMLNEFGLRIPGTSFYHLNNQNGRISYLGMIEFVLPDGEEICIYIELDSKLSKELLGYPELLIDGNISTRNQHYEYSSAKYYSDQLIARTGTYNYPYVNQLSPDTTRRYTFRNMNGFNHMIYRGEGDILLLLSKPKANLFNITASFAWVFLFFYFTLLLWLAIGGLPGAFDFNSPSFKNRIKYRMVQVLILSLIMVGIVTIAFSVKSFKQKNYDSLSEKLLSAMVDIESNIVREGWLHPQYSEYLSLHLVKLSNVFHSDVNLYDSSGVLLATSRPEVFERQLFGSRINPYAWNELVLKHCAKLIHEEKIGDMTYLSAYAPLFDMQNQKVAYLNLPYFTRQGEYMVEVFSIIVALVNIYVLLILFTIFIAVVISDQISKPLELIREKLSKIDITKHNETISYAGKDEVGKLVNEYNRMVEELAESAMKIAQSQRQSAWREMAKQIAHEIKNPLTPIKLNLQYLVKAKKENQPEWEQMFDKFSDTLIDQINALSNIATEFSNFAKMPVGQFDHISLLQVVDDSASLFSAYPNIAVIKNYSLDADFKVYADKEQLQRVFVNLLKNAVQAIGRNEVGIISISLSKVKSDSVLVIVEDNGSGIAVDLQSKLFTPNFTTKSGGMGLGLAISKGIIEVVGGKIWFDTVPGKGTRFFVELPLSQQKGYS
jgi:two-component system, NtrC family, nitrogen regulation sensor histidine kinase NtrY